MYLVINAELLLISSPPIDHININKNAFSAYLYYLLRLFVAFRSRRRTGKKYKKYLIFCVIDSFMTLWQA